MITDKEENNDSNDGDKINQETANIQKILPGFDTFDDYMKVRYILFI